VSVYEQIEQALKTRLVDNIAYLNADRVQIGGGDPLEFIEKTYVAPPRVGVIVLGGKWHRASSKHRLRELKIVTVCVVRSLSASQPKEKEREGTALDVALHDLVDDVIKWVGSAMRLSGLLRQPLEVLSDYEDFDEKTAKAGIAAWVVEWKCAALVDWPPQTQELTPITKFGAEFHLKPGDDTADEDMEIEFNDGD